MPVSKGKTGFLAVFVRELSCIRRHARYPLAMFVFPLLSFVLVWGLFSEQYPHELPIAVVDLDHTHLSRSLIRAVDASPVIRVAFRAGDPAEAKNRMLKGDIYAWLHIPKALERDILEGKGGEVIGFTNSQMLLPGSMISSSLQTVVSTLSAKLNVSSRIHRGAMPEQAMTLLDPVRIDRHVLFNPQLNYMYFLSAALCPTFLQIFVLMVTVMALGSEFKNRTAEQWLKTAGGSVWWAVTGKLAVYFLSFCLVGGIMLAIQFFGFGVPLRGSDAVLTAGTLFLIMAYMAYGLILVFIFPSLRMALSAASFFSGSAFAFVGITFPLAGMPALGKAWSCLLPLTHYLHLFQEQTLRQAPISVSVPDLLIMLVFAGMGYCLIPFFKRHMIDSRYWGKSMIRQLFHNIFMELTAIFRDPGVLIVMVGAVVFYSFVYPLPYSSEVLKQVPLSIVDYDQSPLSRQLARMTDASELIRVISRDPDMAPARRRVESGNSSGILVIPAGFEKEVLKGRKTTVSAYVDATYFLVYRQAMTGLVRTARTLSAGIEISRFKARGWSHEKALIDRSPLNLDTRSLFNPHMGYATYIVPAVLLLLLQQTMLIGIGMLSGTRREQVQEKKAVIPLEGSPMVRILGRTIACMALYLIHVCFFYGVVYQIWDFPLQVDILDMVVFLFPFLLSVVLMGQFLAAFFKSRESSIIMIVWSSMIAVLISGFSWPVETMPSWIRAISLLLPSTWGISGGLRMAQMGASFSHVMNEWLGMWALSLFYLLLAWISTRFLPELPENSQDQSHDPA